MSEQQHEEPTGLAADVGGGAPPQVPAEDESIEDVKGRSSVVSGAGGSAAGGQGAAQDAAEQRSGETYEARGDEGPSAGEGAA